MSFEINGQRFVLDDEVICIDIAPLGDNDIAPPLTIEKEYKVLNCHVDSKGNLHLDVGLICTLEWVRSYETKEHLPLYPIMPSGEKSSRRVHWCHPSRFILKPKENEKKEG